MEGTPKSAITSLVIGCGLSGIAAIKCLKEVGLDVMCIEKSSYLGGLWKYKEKGNGVMGFTHSNISKHTYCFSDFPYPDETPDFPHHSEIEEYFNSYVKHFDLRDDIRFNTQVNSMRRAGDDWVVVTEQVTEDKDGIITPTGKEHIYIAKFVIVATGLHSKPLQPQFEGLDTFSGKIIHSVDYKNAHVNGIVGKKTVVVGIGNSGVDIASHAATVGMCNPVYLSTRSGAWVMPNYIFGRPLDLYACRLLLALPWKFASLLYETAVTVLSGHPSWWNLKPKMRLLQTQPCVSATLIHQIQQGTVKVKPDIKNIHKQSVTFEDGSTVDAEAIILCTGYKMDIPFLPDDLRDKIIDKSDGVNLFKNVFCPEIGPSVGFIGFIQRVTGGVLAMAEMQSRWFAQLCIGSVKLPTKDEMEKSMRQEKEASKSKFYSTVSHKLQRDPIPYCDDIGSFIGVTPELRKHPMLAWRLLLSNCGPAQWRLQGPGKWSKAEEAVRKIPMTELMKLMLIVSFVIIAWGFLTLYFWIF